MDSFVNRLKRFIFFKGRLNLSLRLFSLLFLSLLSLPINAGLSLVLVHGYLSDGSAWRPIGIVNTLQQAGWTDAGHLFPNSQIPNLAVPSPTEHYVYTVTLPSEAPIPMQAQWLDFYLRNVQKRHPNNSLILVGHSAGGVVARLVMVASGIPIKGLVTIATPHLGTDKAEWGSLLSNSPFSWVAPFFGLDTINRSRGLYRDLMREHPSNLLFWLNRQPHPNAFYVSIVRVGFDEWVPSYSQDLNDVPALHGFATTITTVGTHSLHPTDGHLLVSLLEREKCRMKSEKCQ
ncbi:alpha/beta fold hydrolase [Candidatus Parabeggiatoa sp. HSG14]|uniref:lipase family alpha/beta hydrolase n=1 Tax=Candidatus Parabeggiatoa sp. HSG14 TaxID=3055593 RepID=UPI0032E3EBC3